MPASRPVAAGLAACALAFGLQAAAPAATVPTKFLTKDQVPVTSRFGPWDQTPVITGLRDREGCHEQALPRKRTKLRAIYNDSQGNAIIQYAVRMPTTADAKALVKRLTYCGSKAYRDSYSPSFSRFYAYRTLGTFDVENGLLVRAVIFTKPGLPRSIALDAVGRDGRYVMWLDWAFTTKGKVPAMWVKLSRTALAQLRP